MAKKYKNRTTLEPTTGKHKFGKSLTVKGESLSVIDMFRRQTAGVPLPVVRPTLEFPPIESITENSFDLPDIEKFAQLDLVDQQIVQNNIQAFKDHLSGELDRAKAAFQAASKDKDGDGIEDTPPDPQNPES